MTYMGKESKKSVCVGIYITHIHVTDSDSLEKSRLTEKDPDAGKD